MTYDPIWGPIIAAYLFLAGVGGGAFVTCAVIGAKHPHAQKMRRVGHYIAPIVVIIGLCLLMVDAKAGFHSPLRFALLLTNFGSVMTWGVVFLAVFTIVSLIIAIFDWIRKPYPTWLEIIGVIFGIFVAIYTGCLLGVCRTFPLWNNALLPILFLVSAISTGAAAVFLAGLIAAPQEFDECGYAKKLHYFLPLIELLLVAALLFITASHSDAGYNSIMTMIAGTYALPFWIGFIAIGLVIPAIIETKLVFFSSKAFEESASGHRFALAANVGVLIGGFLLRLFVILCALPVTLVTPMIF